MASIHGQGCQQTKKITVESFGYLDELAKIHDDPIAFFEKYVEEKKPFHFLTVVGKRRFNPIYDGLKV